MKFTPATRYRLANESVGSLLSTHFFAAMMLIGVAVLVPFLSLIIPGFEVPSTPGVLQVTLTVLPVGSAVLVLVLAGDAIYRLRQRARARRELNRS